MAKGKKTGGRVAGTPNKITQDVMATLDALGCNPLELSAKIALGEELDGPHPALSAFYAFADDLAKLEDKGGAVTPELIEELRGLIDDNLTAGYVPIELRSKHINELKKYVYPQRKAVDINPGTNPDGSPARMVMIGFVDADLASGGNNASDS